MEGFFKKIFPKTKYLSGLEKQVFHFFVENPQILESSTMQEISDRIFISTATISRTCKKMGFNGFQEFKYSFTNYLKQNHKGMDLTNGIPSVQEQITKYKRELEYSLSIIGKGITDEVINLIINSNRIEFFGVGGSLPLCIEGARKMTFANCIATARSDWDELRVVAQNLNSNDLAIVISFTGETKHIIEYATYLDKNNVPILAIVGSENSHLKK